MSLCHLKLPRGRDVTLPYLRPCADHYPSDLLINSDGLPLPLSDPRGRGSWAINSHQEGVGIERLVCSDVTLAPGDKCKHNYCGTLDGVDKEREKRSGLQDRGGGGVDRGGCCHDSDL